MNPPNDFKHPKSFPNIAERDEYLRRVFPKVSLEFAKINTFPPLFS